jgi:hypothetical protein
MSMLAQALVTGAGLLIDATAELVLQREGAHP